jgi:hypothetical protein
MYAKDDSNMTEKLVELAIGAHMSESFLMDDVESMSDSDRKSSHCGINWVMTRLYHGKMTRALTTYGPRVHCVRSLNDESYSTSQLSSNNIYTRISSPIFALFSWRGPHV